MNIDEFKYVFSKLGRKARTIDEIAYKKEVICPAEIIPGKKAKFLDGQFEKIINFHYESSLELEQKRVMGHDREHHETIAWHIRDITLHSNRMYKSGFVSHFPTDYRKFESSANSHASSYALCTSWAGIKYFGHWLHDDVVTYEIAKKYGDVISLPTAPWSDKDAYTKYFDQNWNNHLYGKIHSLVIFQDYSQNSNKVARYQALRKKIRRKLSEAETNQDKLVYLRRGATGKNRRILENEDDLINSLDKKGFIVVDIEKHSGHEIVEQMLGANLVVTLEGSQQTHALYTLKDRGALINITPPELFTAVAKDWTEAIGFDFGFLLGDKSEKGFTVNIDNLFKTIDLVNP